MSGTPNPYRYQYEIVPQLATDQVLGGAGAAGDFLHRLIIRITGVASYTLYDGTTVVYNQSIAATGGGIQNVEINMASQNGPWKITTGSGLSITAVGVFTN